MLIVEFDRECSFSANSAKLGVMANFREIKKFLGRHAVLLLLLGAAVLLLLFYQKLAPTGFEAQTPKIPTVGKTIIAGITTLDASGKVVKRFQIYGTVSEATSEKFVIRRPNGKHYTLPPFYSNVCPAAPGEYRLRSTGEVVVNPDYTTTWDVHEPFPSDFK